MDANHVLVKPIYYKTTCVNITLKFHLEDTTTQKTQNKPKTPIQTTGKTTRYKTTTGEDNLVQKEVANTQYKTTPCKDTPLLIITNHRQVKTITQHRTNTRLI